MKGIDFGKLAASLAAPPPPSVDRRRSRQLVRQSQLRRVLKRIVALKAEGMALFNPLPAAVPAMASTARWQLFDGSNQSGKTAHAAYKLARIMCGCDPTGEFPTSGGKTLMVGMQLEHVADPMFSKLTREGAFDIIRDEQTGLWRSTRPDPNNPQLLDPYDLAYREKWRPAPPILPPRMIRRIAMEDTAKGIPRAMELTNGWQVRMRSSEGKPWQGVQLTANWLDEELARDQFWISELSARRLRFGGITMWSATPQAGGLQLYQLRQRADAGDSGVEAFTFLLEDNPYMLPEAKEAFFDDLSADEREVRYYGRYLIAGRLIYPQWDPQGVHGCEPHEVPRDATRYVVLDPGTEHCATLFAAVDRNEAHLRVYDGFDLRRPTAGRWAHEVLQRQGEHRFEAFVIDQQMGKQHPPPMNTLNVAEQYFKALSEAQVEPRILGPLGGFFPGSNDVQARQEALFAMMAVRGSGPFAGSAKIQVVRGIIPELHDQVKLAQTDHKTGKRVKMTDDLLDCLEYLAPFDPPYHEPEPVGGRPKNPVYEAFKRKHRKRKPRVPAYI